MDEFLLHLERLADGIYDDGWQHLNNELIAAIHSFPLEWTSMMRRMAVTYDYFHRVAQGDIPAEYDGYSEEEDDDDTDSDYEDESKSD